MRSFGKLKKIVVKVGTNLLTASDGTIDERRIEDIARQIASLQAEGYQMLLVSSGAVGMGARQLGLKSAVKLVPMRQACASIGQPLLMTSYRKAFGDHRVLCAQILLTRSDMNNRTTYVHLRESVGTLLSLRVVPVFNENDVVSTAEVGTAFGDNDRLSAMVASKIDADLLVILTDIEGLYTADPKSHPDAKLISDIASLDGKTMGYAGGAGSTFSTGGMKTKLLAAKIATVAGCGTIIASGYQKDALIKIVHGKELGTYIHPRKRLSQKERWMLNNTHQGALVVDDGAKAALLSHKSLLPSGVVGVEGDFSSGDVVAVKDEQGVIFAKAVPYYDSTQAAQMAGHTNDELDGLLGKGHKDVLFRPEDMVLLSDVGEGR